MGKTRKIMSAGGIGESKVFCAPESERLQTGVDRMLACHIDGVAIRDLKLNHQVLIALDYYATDEGIAEKNARPGPKATPGLSVDEGPWEKSLQQRRDDVKIRDMMLFDARDPMKEVADRHSAPGMRPKFLSPTRMQENGGSGQYEIVKDEKGDPVKVRGMVLAHIPEDIAQARNRHFQEKGNQLLRKLTASAKNEGLIED